MMPRKWEWIGQQCIERGVEKAARMAVKIDDALLKCYRERHTQEWEIFCKYNDTEGLMKRYDFLNVVTSAHFCVACSESEGLCSACLFGAVCGDCGDSDSLFRRFLAEVGTMWPHGAKAMIQEEGGGKEKNDKHKNFAKGDTKELPRMFGRRAERSGEVL